MVYDGFLLSAVVAELKHIISRGRIQKIRQHNDTDLTLEIRGIGHTYLLFFSVDAKFPRVYITASNAPVPPEPPNFCMLMRKYTEGAFITDIEQVGMDRIVRFHIDSSAFGRMLLILEIMGKHSNLILVNADGKILGAIKHVGSSVSRYRQILPSREYLPPPGSDKIDPHILDSPAFDRLWNASLSVEISDKLAVKQWLMNTFSGFGPFLADEITARTSMDGRISRDDVREELLQLSAMVRNNEYQPVFITNERGAGLMVYPMPSVQFPPAQQHPRASIDEALDILFRTLVTRTLLDDERAQTITAIRRATAARKQALKSIERTVEESTRAEQYRQLGELLLANLHAIEKGAKSIALVNYFDPEMPEVEVELDEKLGAQANAERYFKRYKKARDSVSTAEARRNQTIHEISELGTAFEEAESAKTVESLRELRKTLTEQGLLRQEISHERHEDEFGGYRIRRFLTPDGWEILYGENSQANDYLTQRVARPNDVWLHARQITGAHVVIRTSGRKMDIPKSVLNTAAKIAAMNSDAKHSSLVPVDRTLRKFVRKPRGSAPGFVLYRNEKTIDINPKA